MNILQKYAFAYFILLLAATSINYIPGLTDDTGLAFGIFALDIYDDALHAASALWALVAAIHSPKSARIFLAIFGAAYLGDGFFGLFTGWGFLDLGIFTNRSLGLELSLGRILANLPHILMGAVALCAALTKGQNK